jgi:hypothetical protein
MDGAKSEKSSEEWKETIKGPITVRRIQIYAAPRKFSLAATNDYVVLVFPEFGNNNFPIYDHRRRVVNYIKSTGIKRLRDFKSIETGQEFLNRIYCPAAVKVMKKCWPGGWYPYINLFEPRGEPTAMLTVFDKQILKKDIGQRIRLDTQDALWSYAIGNCSFFLTDRNHQADIMSYGGRILMTFSDEVFGEGEVVGRTIKIK